VGTRLKIGRSQVGDGVVEGGRAILTTVHTHFKHARGQLFQIVFIQKDLYNTPHIVLIELNINGK